MNKEARWLWNYLAPRLERVGLISEIDLPTFAILCQQFGVFAAAEKHLKKTGTRTAEYTNKAGATNVVEVAEAKIARNAAITFKSLASEFGLSPASRARLCGSPASRQEDELDELLKRAGL
ncbi:MAG: phage terminase small subunit P27 family [Bacillota bacterium]